MLRTTTTTTFVGTTGYSYHQGVGVPPSLPKALKLLQAAALKQHSTALYYLVSHTPLFLLYCYFFTVTRTRGVNACTQFLNISQAMMYGNGEGVEKDDAQMLKYLEDAAQLEHPDSLYWYSYLVHL